MIRCLTFALMLYALLIAAPSSVHAQAYPCSGPGPGEVVVGETQAGNGVASVPLCQRTGGSPQGTASQPQWQDRWGTIATDEPNAVLGTSSGRSSRQAAEQAALADCQAKGGSSCKLGIPYRNGCVAFTVSDSNFTTTADITLEVAKTSGMETCKKSGAAHCRTYYSACSPPVRIQ